MKTILRTTFPNGFTVSVAQYAHQAPLLEVAVLRKDGEFYWRQPEQVRLMTAMEVLVLLDTVQQL